ncbi:MAG: Ricin-type beta-trefoil lectin domain [Myxococcales bacterium]|nr:Ricin-type beta-trefoil lectin domain [Myxococcales bacterium]
MSMNRLRLCTLFLLAATPCACGGNGDGLETGETASAVGYQTFNLKNNGNLYCLDGYQSGNINPYMNYCNIGNQYQRWYWDTSAVYTHLCNVGTGKCLDGYVAAAGGYPYMQIQYPTDIYQGWYQGPGAIYNGILIRNAGNGSSCLDGYLAGGPAGGKPYLYPCSYTDGYQSWTMVY